MPTIRVLDKPRNLFHSVLSRKWHLVLEGDRTLLFDGDKPVLEEVHFPCAGGWGELRELRLPNGDHFRRQSPSAQWVCIGGSLFGQRFDCIMCDMEEAGQESHWFESVFVNVVAFDYRYMTFSD